MVEYVNSTTGVLTEAVYPEVVRKIIIIDFVWLTKVLPVHICHKVWLVNKKGQSYRNFRKVNFISRSNQEIFKIFLLGLQKKNGFKVLK